MIGRTKDAVGCIITDERGRVLLVHQTYGRIADAVSAAPGVVMKSQRIEDYRL